jgi:molecular chaperone GrpE
VNKETYNQPDASGEAHEEANATEQPNSEEISQDPSAATEETNQAPPEEEVDEVTQLKNEVAEAKDKYLRLFAEFENFRRRTAKERLDLVKTAGEGVISELLPVVDDFERSLQIFKDNEAVAPMYEGIQLVHGKLTKALAQKGLKVMGVEVGDDFDAEYHEAVVQTPAPSEDLKGKIVDVIDKGYFLGDKVLRYAKVVIGS